MTAERTVSCAQCDKALGGEQEAAVLSGEVMGVTVADLRRDGYNEEVIAALENLTKSNKNEDYDHFIGRVATNPLACRVKLADIEDNLSLRRLAHLNSDDLERIQTYHGRGGAWRGRRGGCGNQLLSDRLRSR